MFNNGSTEGRFLGINVVDVPAEILEDKVYVVGEKKNKWLAILRCPCGCNETIQLNLLKAGSVCWTTKIHRNRTVTIRPSIWRTTGCKSHFTIKRGFTGWIRDWEWET